MLLLLFKDVFLRDCCVNTTWKCCVSVSSTRSHTNTHVYIHKYKQTNKQTNRHTTTNYIMQEILQKCQEAESVLPLF